ncbi:MAG: universal stress protein [Gammaproteobacteria bacterium]
MNILVCIDLSESTDVVVQKAYELAKFSSAKVWILFVAEPEPDFVGFDVGPRSERDFLATKFHGEHRKIQEIADRFREDSIDATALMFQGATVETIVKQASKIKSDIIVVGSHGKGLAYQLIVGSVSEQIIQRAECPIFVVPVRKRT